jgi:hypothetical protein
MTTAMVQRLNPQIQFLSGNREWSHSFSSLPRTLQERLVRLMRQSIGTSSFSTLKNSDSLRVKKRGDKETIGLVVEENAGEEGQDIVQVEMDHALFSAVSAFRAYGAKVEKEREKKTEGGILAFLKKRAPETVAVGVDLASIARNSLSIVDPLANSVTALGFAGGSGGVVSGAWIAYNSIKNFQESKRIGDQKGQIQGALNVLGGTAYSGVGTGMILSKAAIVHGIAGLGTVAGSGLIDPLCLVMYLSILVSAGLSLKETTDFRSSLEESIKNGGLDGGVAFLAKALTLTEEEIARANDSTDPEKEMARLLDCKAAVFTRNTDQETCSLVRDALHAGSIDKKKTTAILEAVSKANYRKIIKATVLLIIAISGLIATVVSIAMTGGVPCYLFIIVASMWILIDKSGLSDDLANLLWKMHVPLFGRLTDLGPERGALQGALEEVANGPLKVVMLGREKVTVPQQTALDYFREARTALYEEDRLLYKSPPSSTGRGGGLGLEAGERVLRQFQTWTHGDEEAFLILSGLLNQTSKSVPITYVAEYLSDLDVTYHSVGQEFRKKKDHLEYTYTFEVRYPPKPKLVLRCRATSRLEWKDGRLVCGDPVFQIV